MENIKEITMSIHIRDIREPIRLLKRTNGILKKIDDGKDKKEIRLLRADIKSFLKYISK